MAVGRDIDFAVSRALDPAGGIDRVDRIALQPVVMDRAESMHASKRTTVAIGQHREDEIEPGLLLWAPIILRAANANEILAVRQHASQPLNVLSLVKGRQCSQAGILHRSQVPM